MIKVAVTGAAGRMGQRIIALVTGAEGMMVTGAIESPLHNAVGHDAGLGAGCGLLKVAITAELASALEPSEVLIDFTWPEVTMQNLAECVRLGKSMVIGTTGLNPQQRSEVEAASRHIPIVFAPNMSVGVNVCFKLLKELAATLGDDFDVEIVELHHNKKKDSPSGTAVRMGEVVAEALGRDYGKVANYHREGMCGERSREEIGMQTVRGGDIVGEHTVYFIGMGERIELSHRAMSRDMFARGAIRAANWLAQQAPGLYDMQDVLGLKE